MKTLIQSNFKGFVQIDKYEVNKYGIDKFETEYDIFDKRRVDLSIKVTFRGDGETRINWWGDGGATIQEFQSFQRLLDIADELIREEN